MEQGRTRVSYQRNPNFMERVSKSLGGIVIGLILLVGSSCLLFWNEGRAVQTAKSLDEGLNLVVPLQNPYVISTENNGKLVHLTGPLYTEKSLHDVEYNVEICAVRLKRTVEMYQWKEHESERKIDEGNGKTRVEKTYSYSQVWSSSVIRSSGFDDHFNHENPSDIPISERQYLADTVTVGDFHLSAGLVGKINKYVPVQLDKRYHKETADRKIHNGYFYHSKDPFRPQTGDVRVLFEYAGLCGSNPRDEVTVVSIVARQINEKLLPYQTLAGDILELLYEGKLSAKAIFNKEQMQNSMMTWGLRCLGWLVMFIGFHCLTSILTTLVDWVPVLRDVISLGVCLMNMSLSISMSLTIIALGWIYYRPLLGLSLLAMATTPFIMSRFRAQSTRSQHYDYYNR